MSRRKLLKTTMFSLRILNKSQILGGGGGGQREATLFNVSRHTWLKLIRF